MVHSWLEGLASATQRGLHAFWRRQHVCLAIAAGRNVHLAPWRADRQAAAAAMITVHSLYLHGNARCCTVDLIAGSDAPEETPATPAERALSRGRARTLPMRAGVGCRWQVSTLLPPRSKSCTDAQHPSE